MAIDIDDAVARIEREVLASRLRFTLPDAAAMTGLPVERVRDAMAVVLRRYDCRAQVTENADLVYDFGNRLQRRDGYRPGAFTERLKSGLWRAFQYFYKSWISITLIAYVLVFAALLLVLLVGKAAQAGGGRGGDRSQRSGDRNQRSGRSSWSAWNLHALARLIASIFEWRTHTQQTRRRTDDRGYPYRQYEPKPSPVDDAKKGFVAAIHDFVFGPPRVEIDPLADQREVAAFLRQQRGVVVATEIQALSGRDAVEAELFLTDCVANFEGDLRVSDDGDAYGHFPKLLRGIGSESSGPVVHYWDEYEPDFELTGNDGRTDRAVVLLNLANLVFASLIVFGVLPAWAAAVAGPAIGTLIGSGLARLLLGWAPLAFSLIFFAVPLLRRPGVEKKRRARVVHNQRKRLFKAIFDARGDALSVAEVTAVVNRDRPEEPLTAEVVEPILNLLMVELGGSIDYGADDEPRFSFPRIRRELDAAERLRRGSTVDHDLGAVVVDSGNSTPPPAA